MKPTLDKDAFGQEIWAYYNKKESVEIIERDDGFVDISGGAEAYFSEYPKWSDHEKRALKLVKGKVLDVGCGAGRISLYLQKKGFDVTGNDNSLLACRVSRARGVKKVKSWGIEDIPKFKSAEFDTIVMLGNGFGLFGSGNKAKRLLKTMYKITSDDALIIAESLDPYQTTDPVHKKYHKFNRSRGRMSGQLKIRVRFRDFIGPWFDYLLVSKKELEQVVKGTGWKVKKYINSKGAMYIVILEKDTR